MTNQPAAQLQTGDRVRVKNDTGASMVGTIGFLRDDYLILESGGARWYINQATKI